MGNGHKDNILADLRVSPLFSFVSFVDDMEFPPLIVAPWKILTIVAAAALFAPQRRARDQPRDGHQIAMAPLIRSAGRRRCRRTLECLHSLNEALSRPEQSGVAPHQITDGFAGQG